MHPVARTYCPHYPLRWLFPIHPRRRLVAPCRLCYAERGDDSTPFPRKDVEAMVCAFCACAQPCAGHCRNPDCTAHERPHSYYCGVCHLWEHRPGGGREGSSRVRGDGPLLEPPPPPPIYHCDQCGICRIGPRSMYRHCGGCGMCVPRRLPHRCWGELHGASCPVCYEPCDQHGREPITFLACGHALHTACCRQLFEHGHYACPTCGRVV